MMPWASAESRVADASSSTAQTAVWASAAAAESGVWPLAARVSIHCCVSGEASSKRTASSLPSHAAYQSALVCLSLVSPTSAFAFMSASIERVAPLAAQYINAETPEG